MGTHGIVGIVVHPYRALPDLRTVHLHDDETPGERNKIIRKPYYTKSCPVGQLFLYTLRLFKKEKNQKKNIFVFC